MNVRKSKSLRTFVTGHKIKKNWERNGTGHPSRTKGDGVIEKSTCGPETLNDNI